jgi:hypothetical protein
LAARSARLDDRFDHRLEALVTEHHGAEHDLFRELLGFGLNHQHGVGGAGDDEVELVAFGHLARWSGSARIRR